MSISCSVIVNIVSVMVLVIANVTHTFMPYSVARLTITDQDRRPQRSLTDMERQIIYITNTSADPCNDFYNFVCGKFRTKSTPNDRMSWTNFAVVSQEIKRQLKSLVHKPFRNLTWNSIQAFVNIQYLYQSCMDENRLSKDSLEPIKEKLLALGGWPLLEGKNWKENNFDWITYTYKLKENGLQWTHFIDIYVDVDNANSSRRIIYISEGENYLSNLVTKVGLKSDYVKKYIEYQIYVAVLFGASPTDAEEEFVDAMKLGIELAKIHSTPTEERLSSNNDNKYTIEDLTTAFPYVPWLEYINKLFSPFFKITQKETVSVPTVKYFQKLGNIVKSASNRTLANYLMWFIVRENAPLVSTAIHDELIRLNNVLVEATSSKVLWQQCLDTVMKELPLQINSLYAWYIKQSHKYTKEKAIELTDQLKKATEIYFIRNNWLNQSESKTKAMEKLAAINFQVGFPEEVFDRMKLDAVYDFELHPSKFLQNIWISKKATTDRDIKMLRLPVDKKDWINHLWTTEANAGYSTSDNSIVVSAGILQGVFFHEDQMRALNYGALGSILGHEVTHGFDDLGRHYDENGELGSLWDEDTEKKFKAVDECFERLNNNSVIKDVNGKEYKLKGPLTKGETMSDIGGAKLAYYAYLDTIKKYGEDTPMERLQSYTPKQLFWIAVGGAWCASRKPSELRQIIKHEAHPPEEYRVNSIASNNKEFAKDFNCPINSPMNPEHKCTIW